MCINELIKNTTFFLFLSLSKISNNYSYLIIEIINKRMGEREKKKERDVQKKKRNANDLHIDILINRGEKSIIFFLINWTIININNTKIK